jgi:hypothetical protein
LDRDGDDFRAVVATRDAPPAYVEARKRRLRLQPAPDAPLGRAVATKRVVQIADLRELQSYHDRDPPTRKGFGTHVIERMIREQLKGEMHLDWRAEGLTCEIVLKCVMATV